MAVTLVAGFLALATLLAAVSVLTAQDRRFEARLNSRLRPEPSGPATPNLAAELAPKLIKTVIAWGERAGKGGLQDEARQELSARLVQAGFHSPRAAEAFFGIRAMGAAALAAIGVLLALVLGVHNPVRLVVVAMVTANIGLFAPKIFLAQRIKTRGQALKLALPDAIDLMVVSVEAGSTLSAAIHRVQAEFGRMHPVLAEHFGFLMVEMQAGATRAESLARFADRAGIDEARSLATLLIQSEAVGASLGGTLRVFAEDLRKKRFLEAERKAAELPVKMTFPLVFCIFPCLMGVIFVPIIIRLMRTMFH